MFQDPLESRLGGRARRPHPPGQSAPRQPQVLPDAQGRAGLVHGIEVQARGAAFEEAAAEVAHHLQAEGADPLQVVAVADGMALKASSIDSSFSSFSS